MARLETRVASHRGIVKAVRNGFVDIEIESTSACATCQAHSRCGFAESKNKTVSVPSDKSAEYNNGDSVTVHIDESRGMLAVWIAYVLPAIVMLGLIIALSLIHAPEWLVAVSALAILGLYVGALYLLRDKIGKKFTLTVEKC